MSRFAALIIATDLANDIGSHHHGRMGDSGCETGHVKAINLFVVLWHGEAPKWPARGVDQQNLPSDNQNVRAGVDIFDLSGEAVRRGDII